MEYGSDMFGDSALTHLSRSSTESEMEGVMKALFRKPICIDP